MSERFCICGKPLVRRAKEPETTFQKRKSCSFACIWPTLQAERRAAVWEHVQKTDSCWLWTGAQAHWRGYGRYGKQLAHRYIWELYNGPINPTSLCVLHRCDNPRCVNPAHLFLGTRSDNIEDMMAKGRNKPLKGEANKRSKLKEYEVLEIAQMLADGVDQSVIAAKYSVSMCLISRINTGRAWKYLLHGKTIELTADAVASKFWAKTEPEPTSGCSLWSSGPAVAFRGKTRPFRQVAWELAHGEIPKGLFVISKCGNPLCVNPLHLELSKSMCGSKILNAAKVREIRRKWQKGGGVLGKGYQETRTITQGALAKEYGVNRVLISAILLGKSWKHVE